MKKFKITWQPIDKFVSIKRENIVQASDTTDAITVFRCEFGNSRKTEIYSVEEVVDQNDT